MKTHSFLRFAPILLLFIGAYIPMASALELPSDLSASYWIISRSNPPVLEKTAPAGTPQDPSYNYYWVTMENHSSGRYAVAYFKARKGSEQLVQINALRTLPGTITGLQCNSPYWKNLILAYRDLNRPHCATACIIACACQGRADCASEHDRAQGKCEENLDRCRK